jgi:acyl-CoA oxidase
MTVETALADLAVLGILKSLTVCNVKGAAQLRSEISRVCMDLLPERIALTDALGFTDWELDSALGVYDGKVYERLWKRAQSNPLNNVDASELHKVSEVASTNYVLSN